MDIQTQPDQGVVSLLQALERHGIVKITEHIDAGEYDEACQVVGILKGVGII